MKYELRVSFLNTLQNQRNNPGFTIIELLIVIIVIGIISAIALPSILNQASKGRQLEAKQYTAAMNRAQQVYYMESLRFTTSLKDLGLGIETQTKNYDYTVNISPDQLFVTHNGVSKTQLLRSYAGVTYINTVNTAVGSMTLSILCESEVAEIGSAQMVESGGCPSDYQKSGQ